MKKNLLSVLCALLVVLTIVVVGCRKMDSSPDLNKNQKFPQGVLDKLKAQEGQVIIPVNETVQGYVSDENGNPIDFSRRNHNRSLSTDPSLCDFPQDIEYTATLKSLGKEFTCNVGYKINATWEISTNVDMLLASNPLNSS